MIWSCEGSAQGLRRVWHSPFYSLIYCCRAQGRSRTVLPEVLQNNCLEETANLGGFCTSFYFLLRVILTNASRALFVHNLRRCNRQLHSTCSANHKQKYLCSLWVIINAYVLLHILSFVSVSFGVIRAILTNASRALFVHIFSNAGAKDNYPKRSSLRTSSTNVRATCE